MQGSGAAARLPKAVGAPGMMGGVIATPPTILGGRVAPPCGMAPVGVVHEEHACVVGVPQLVLQCAQFAPAQCELGNAPFAGGVDAADKSGWDMCAAAVPKGSFVNPLPFCRPKPVLGGAIGEDTWSAMTRYIHETRRRESESAHTRPVTLPPRVHGHRHAARSHSRHPQVRSHTGVSVNLVGELIAPHATP